MKTRFTKWQIGGMVALPLAIMLNPVVIEIYIEFVKQILEGISFIAGAYFVCFALYKMLKPEKPHLPKVGKAGGKDGLKYVATKPQRA